jgi:PAS domain S-box-containing protein
MKKLLLILFAVVLCGNSFSQGNQSFINSLSSTEKQWLENNKSIKILFHKTDFKPIWYYDGHNRSGISSDYLDIILELTGWQVDTIIADWSYGYTMISGGSVDLVCSIVKTENREEEILFSSPQIFLEHYVCTAEDGGALPESLSDLQGSVIALEKGFYLGEILKKDFPGIAVTVYENSTLALKAVSEKKADFYIGNKLNIDYVVANEGLKLKIQRFFDIPDYPVCFGINKSCPVLKSIIDKALNFIPVNDKKIINEKNIPKFESNTLFLFEDEKEYLQNLGQLKVGFKSFREPLEFLDENGNPNGVIFEIFKIIALKLDLKFKPVFYSDNGNMLRDAKNGKLDIIASVDRTPERSKYLLFSDTFLSFPYLVVGLSSNEKIRNLKDIKNKKIAVYSSHYLVEELTSSFPDCEVTNYITFKEFFNALADDDADFGITNKISYNYFSQIKKYGRLDLYFESNYTENCCFGVSQKHTRLVPILNRAIALTGKTTTGYVVDKWESTPPPAEYDIILIRNIFVIFSLLFLAVATMFLFHYLRLRRELRNVKSLESKLSSSEEEYSRIFNSMNDIYYRLDVKGNILKLSPSVYKVSGYTPTELIGKNEIVFYKDPKERERLLKAIFEKGYINNYRITLLKSSGDELPVSVNAKLLYDSSNSFIGFEGILRDVSDSVNSEKSLANSQQKLKSIIELAGLGISSYDAIDKCLELNAAISQVIYGHSEIFKVSVHELLELVHPFDRNNIEMALKSVLEGENDEVSFDCRIAAFDGYFAWYSNRFVRIKANEHTEIIGVHLNITDLKNNITVLTENQRKLEAIYNSVQLMLIAVDKNMNIREVNDEVVALSGLMKDEIIGRSFKILCSDEKNKSGKEKIFFPCDVFELTQRSLNHFDNIYDYEFAAYQCDQNGERLVKYFSLSTSVYTVDEKVQLLASFIDITSRKNFELEVEKARSILEENSRMKTDFISNLSYELRTPINSIWGFVSLLKNKSVSQQEKEKYVEIIKDSSGKLLSIVDNVIELSKAEFNELVYQPGSFKPAELLRLLQNQFVQQASSKNLSLKIEILQIEASNIIDTDYHKVKSVLTHFIENAIKYTYKGEVIIGVRKLDLGTEFFVKDTGIGITKPEALFLSNEEKSNEISILQEFDGGMGISLRLCKAYLELIDSEILVKSTLGEGSQFSFVIKDSKKIPIEQPSSEKPSTPSLGVVLIVEDEDYNYDYLSQILELENYEYIIADDGQKAIDFVKDGMKIDIILMDVRLPGIDGIEASRQIKSINPKIPIIAQTAYNLDTDQDRLMDHYCDDYIQKPIVSKVLIKKISELLGKK